MVTNLTTDCDDTFTNSFTYIPNDQSCRVMETPPEPVEPSFTIGSGGGTGFRVIFTNTSTGPFVSASWVFDADGASGVAPTPPTSSAQDFQVVDYFEEADPPVYRATLTLTDADGVTYTTSQPVTLPIM